jgi:hypothetical protein
MQECLMDAIQDGVLGEDGVFGVFGVVGVFGEVGVLRPVLISSVNSE